MATDEVHAESTKEMIHVTYIVSTLACNAYGMGILGSPRRAVSHSGIP